MEQCLVENGFVVQDNKAALLADGALSITGGWTVLQAAEVSRLLSPSINHAYQVQVDLAKYITFAASISPCFVGACQPDLVRAFFTNYIKESQALITRQLQDFLTPWATALQNSVDYLEDLRPSFNVLLTEVTAVEARIEKIREDLCKDVDTCVEDVITRFYEQGISDDDP